jgi:hypothetical protein
MDVTSTRLPSALAPRPPPLAYKYIGAMVNRPMQKSTTVVYFMKMKYEKGPWP